MAEPASPGDDVLAREVQLRRRVRERIVPGGDPALAEVHRAILARRSRRSRVGFEPGPPVETLPDRAATPTAGGPAGRVLAIDAVGTTVRVFRIGRPAGFTFRAGQYVKLGVAGGELEDFSIASAPHEPDLELAIELRPGGAVTPALFGLRVGDAVAIKGTAKGKLLLDPTVDHHLMVATVTGIAPLRSMVREALHRGTPARFTILLGASYASELPFHDELVALAEVNARVRYVATVSRPDEAANRTWTGPTGRVDALARTAAAELDPASTRVYAVGNKGMIDTVVRDLGGAGFPVTTESYGG